MKKVYTKDLKKGQIVLIGELGVGEFGVAEVMSNQVKFKNWDKIDMNKGTLLKNGNGEVSQEDKGYLNVLNSSEVKKVEMIKNKILMLENLKEDKK